MYRPRIQRFARGWGLFRLGAAGLLVGALLLGTCGAGCENSDFRQTATEAIGSGLKTILDGIIDGLVAAVSNAGDASSSSS